MRLCWTCSGSGAAPTGSVQSSPDHRASSTSVLQLVPASICPDPPTWGSTCSRRARLKALSKATEKRHGKQQHVGVLAGLLLLESPDVNLGVFAKWSMAQHYCHGEVVFSSVKGKA